MAQDDRWVTYSCLLTCRPDRSAAKWRSWFPGYRHWAAASVSFNN